MSGRNICSMHGDIERIADELIGIEISEMKFSELIELDKTIKKHGEELKELAVEAGDAGQSMEDRMKEYRDAIEGLGFSRNKKKKK